MAIKNSECGGLPTAAYGHCLVPPENFEVYQTMKGAYGKSIQHYVVKRLSTDQLQ